MEAEMHHVSHDEHRMHNVTFEQTIKALGTTFGHYCRGRVGYFLDQFRSDLSGTLESFEKVVREEENIACIIPTEEVVVIADIHGQLWNLGAILTKVQSPSKDNILIFNGDIIDRGPSSVECQLLVYALKLAAPQFVFVLRGNHETASVAADEYGYTAEVHHRFGHDTYEALVRTFSVLPLGLVVMMNGRRVLIVHGGIPNDPCTLESLNRLDRLEWPLNKLVEEILWNDFNEEEESTPGVRAVGLRVGAKSVQQFFKDNEIDQLIRGHSHVLSGFQKSHDGLVHTVCAYYAYRPTYLVLGAHG